MFHFLKNFKMGQKVGGLYRTKNKEQGREKYKIPDQLGPPGQTRLEWERGRKYRAGCWRGVGGLADWIYCISGQGEHVQGYKSYLSFPLLTWHPEQEQLHLGPGMLFSRRVLLKV